MENQEQKPKGGRPKKEEKRHHKMGFNATENERNIIRGKAFQTGLNVADYLRDCGLKGKPRKVLNEEQRKLYRDLSGMSNNLNQITKEAHKQNLPTLAPLILRALNEINTTLKIIQNDY